MDLRDLWCNFADKAPSETKGSTVKVKNGSTLLESTVPAERRMENRLRDLLLDIEDRIYQGTLGSIKVWWHAVFLFGCNVIFCLNLKKKKSFWIGLHWNMGMYAITHYLNVDVQVQFLWLNMAECVNDVFPLLLWIIRVWKEVHGELHWKAETMTCWLLKARRTG